MKEFLRSRSLKLSLMFCLAVSMLVCTAFAAEAGEAGGTTSQAIISAFETGFQQIRADAFSVIAIAVPVAVSIAAVIFIAKKAMGWFKSMAK